MMLRLPETLQRYLDCEHDLTGLSKSEIVRFAIINSKGYHDWLKRENAQAKAALANAEREEARVKREQARRDRIALTAAEREEARVKREQARLERIAAQAASKPERIFDIKRREDIEFDVKYFQEPDGARVMAEWGDDHTWESMISRIRRSYRDGYAVRCTNPEAHDRELKTLLDTRIRVYREAGVELPELKPGLVEPAIPRCEHWVPLAQDCTKCADAAMVETIQAALDGGPDAVAELVGISGSGDPGEL